ncbi:thiamine pyrophosphokinase, partial [Lecanoromycetidae sp. Uapishka_2]
MTPTQDPKIWRPARFSMGAEDTKELEEQFAVLVLNQPIENKPLFMQLCERANTLNVADGGANRMKDLLSKDEESLNVICGDLDSIRPEVRAYYEDKDFQIIHDPDQYATDMTKTLKWIRGRSGQISDMDQPEKSPNRLLHIAIFGGLGGRADQAFSQLHHLYRVALEPPIQYAGDLYLITTDGVIFLLERGMNKIYSPVGPGFFTENVGIIPIGKPSIITTRGLEWDVEDWHTEFGRDISTSNHIRAAVIEVETTERVLFTMEFAPQRGK